MTGTGREPLVVVLGASGLLGTAIVRELAARPVRLRAVARRPTAVPAVCRAAVEVRTVDLTVPGELAGAVEDADAVVHLVMYAGAGGWKAAEHDGEAERVNVGLMRDLVEAVRAGRTAPRPAVIFAATILPHDGPHTVYERQKIAAESALRAATSEGLLRGSSLQLTTLFSQGTDPTVHDRGVVAAMTRRALAGQPLTLWNGGVVLRDLICVDDVARAFVAALDHADALAGGHWPVGAGQATSVATLFNDISRAVFRSTGRPPVPVTSVAPPADSVATDQVDCVCDPSAFHDLTGWSARIPLRAALERLASSLDAADAHHTPAPK